MCVCVHLSVDHHRHHNHIVKLARVSLTLFLSIRLFHPSLLANPPDYILRRHSH